jgi:hypothetical protein
MKVTRNETKRHSIEQEDKVMIVSVVEFGSDIRIVFDSFVSMSAHNCLSEQTNTLSKVSLAGLTLTSVSLLLVNKNLGEWRDCCLRVTFMSVPYSDVSPSVSFFSGQSPKDRASSYSLLIGRLKSFLRSLHWIRLVYLLPFLCPFSSSRWRRYKDVFSLYHSHSCLRILFYASLASE